MSCIWSWFSRLTWLRGACSILVPGAAGPCLGTLHHHHHRPPNVSQMVIKRSRLLIRASHRRSWGIPSLSCWDICAPGYRGSVAEISSGLCRRYLGLLARYRGSGARYRGQRGYRAPPRTVLVRATRPPPSLRARPHTQGCRRCSNLRYLDSNISGYI